MAVATARGRTGPIARLSTETKQTRWPRGTDALRRLFRTKRLATIRAGFVEQELAAGRLPDLASASRSRPRRRSSRRRGPGARRASTSPPRPRDQHRIQLDKLLPLIGTQADRHARRARRSSTSSPSSTGRATRARRSGRRSAPAAMVLDHAGVYAEPGPRPLDQAAARGAGGDQPAERRRRRGRLPAASRRSTGWRCSGSTGRARASRAST